MNLAGGKAGHGIYAYSVLCVCHYHFLRNLILFLPSTFFCLPSLAILLLAVCLHLSFLSPLHTET